MQPWIDTGVPARSWTIDGYAASGPACRLMSATTQPCAALASSGAHKASAASDPMIFFMAKLLCRLTEASFRPQPEYAPTNAACENSVSFAFTKRTGRRQAVGAKPALQHALEFREQRQLAHAHRCRRVDRVG